MLIWFFKKLIIGDATVSNSWYFTNQCLASGLIPVFGFSPCHPIVDQPRHIVNNSCRLIRFFSQKSYHPVYPLKNWSGWTITTSCPSVERWEIVGRLPKKLAYLERSFHRPPHKTFVKRRCIFPIVEFYSSSIQSPWNGRLNQIKTYLYVHRVWTSVSHRMRDSRSYKPKQ